MSSLRGRLDQGSPRRGARRVGSPCGCARQVSLRAYLRELLSDHVALPSMGEWLQRVRDRCPAVAGAPTGPELVAAAHAEDDELIGR